MDRRSVVVRGIVQGVGFRPFVHRLATECRLAGFVRNRSDGVAIEIEGDEAAIERFLEALPRSAPRLPGSIRFRPAGWYTKASKAFGLSTARHPARRFGQPGRSFRPIPRPARPAWRSCAIQPIGDSVIPLSTAPIAARD